MKKNLERNAMIAQLRSGGYTLAELAGRYGISKERVRQILEAEQPELNGRKGPLLFGLRALAVAAGCSESTAYDRIRAYNIVPVHVSSGGEDADRKQVLGPA